MNNEFGIKELYSVKIKATSNIEIGNHSFEPGENIVVFDKIQIGNIEEIRKTVTAHGGYDDRDLVWWDTTKSVSVKFLQGIVDKMQFSLMSNSKIFSVNETVPILLSAREVVESDGEGKIELKDREVIRGVFIYKVETGERLNYQRISNNVYKIDSPTGEAQMVYPESLPNVDNMPIYFYVGNNFLVELNAVGSC